MSKLQSLADINSLSTIPRKFLFPCRLMKTLRKVNKVLLKARMTERREKVKRNGVSYRWLEILKTCTFEEEEKQAENELGSSVTGVLHTLVADGHGSTK